tara:strand:- start:29 stop:907 length:879 start_codon:yes stop_codon:yes gene_type:complete
MRSQGLSTAQVIQSLKEQGVSPREINEALSQSEVNQPSQNSQPGINPQSSQTPQNPNPPQTAPEPQTQLQNPTDNFAGQVNDPLTQQMPSQQPPEPISNIQTQQMSPSIMPQQETQQVQQLPQPPHPDQSIQQNNQPVVYEQNQPYPEYQPIGSEESYEPYQEYSSGVDIETITDLANQIIEDKMQKMKKEMITFSKVSRNMEAQTNELKRRLEKIENTIEALQMSIIKKIGDYGEDIKKISKELDATQDSFSKMVDPIMDKERKKIQNPSKEEKSKPPKTKKSDSFEDYLR